jgi:translocation and assembly module TamB
VGQQLCVNDLSLRDINVAIDTKKMPPSAPVEEEDSGPLNLSTPYPDRSRVALITSISKSTTPLSVRISPPACAGRRKT